MTIEIKFLVVAYGGTYDDAWTRNLRAFSTKAAAEQLIANYDKWLTGARAMKYPESIAEGQDDFTDDQWKLLAEQQSEFEQQHLLKLGIPDEDLGWIKENHFASYSCDWPSYKIERLQFSNI
jgi:hypothetical protein